MKIVALLLVMLGSFSTAVLLPGIGDLATADMGALTGVVVTDAFSWCAVPLYAWMLVNGFRRTHAAGWYLVRLAVLAVVSEVPYDMATSGRFFDMTSQNPVWGLCIALIALMVLRAFQGRRDVASWAIRIAVLLAAGRFFDMTSQNPVWGLCIALIALMVLRAFQGRRDVASWAIRIAVLLAATLWAYLFNVGLRLGLVGEGLMTLVFAVIFYTLARRENTMMLTAGAFGACMFILPVLGVMLLHWRSRREGYPAPWVKWLFYVLYPLQLLAFGLVGMA